MDPCLRLALLEASFSSPIVQEVLALPLHRRVERYSELMASNIPSGVNRLRWTEWSELRSAIPSDVGNRIGSLASVEGYSSLTLINLSEAEIEDLSPLTELPHLKLLALRVAAEADLTPLLSCDELVRIHIVGISPSRSSAYDVLNTLATRGVQVDNLLPEAENLSAPFNDPVLKLAILDSLGPSLDVPRLHSFDDYRLDNNNLTRLLAVEVPQKELDCIETLTWEGGGHEISHAVWPQWDGESDEFTIRSLVGIEALRNLRKLEISPLEAIPADQVTSLRMSGVEVTDPYASE
ncbi:DUF6892 domain-containing protein [Streptomyces bobili]|uniref:DUF6892 domain-containing protein n=1 Tax=Streptomyces bobili TaxID=67280 RepID=UPI00380FD89C